MRQFAEIAEGLPVIPEVASQGYLRYWQELFLANCTVEEAAFWSPWMTV
jgi:hypothetical protein